MSSLGNTSSLTGLNAVFKSVKGSVKKYVLMSDTRLGSNGIRSGVMIYLGILSGIKGVK